MSTDIAPLSRVLTQLAVAADAGLTDALSIDVMPQGYDHIVDCHLRLGYDAGPATEAAIVATWRDWWTTQGATDWGADSDFRHHHLRGEWCGWQIVLTWLGETTAADMLPAEAAVA